MSALDFGSKQVGTHVVFDQAGSKPGSFNVTSPFGRTVIGIAFDQNTGVKGSAVVDVHVTQGGKLVGSKSVAMHVGQNARLMCDTPIGEYEMTVSASGPTAFAVTMAHTRAVSLGRK